MGALPGACELEELPFTGEKDDSNLGIAENRQVVRFLEQSSTAFGEGNLSGRGIFDSPEFSLAANHS